jgi:hypothetical protein
MVLIKNFFHNSDIYDLIRSLSILFSLICPIFFDFFRQLTLCLKFIFNRNQTTEFENDTCDYHLYSDPTDSSNRNVPYLADFFVNTKYRSTEDLLLEIFLLRISSS